MDQPIQSQLWNYASEDYKKAVKLNQDLLALAKAAHVHVPPQFEGNASAEETEPDPFDEDV
jgi:hypothetical protein